MNSINKGNYFCYTYGFRMVERGIVGTWDWEDMEGWMTKDGGNRHN